MKTSEIVTFCYLCSQRALLHISPFVPRRYDQPMATTRSVFRYRIRNWREYNRALINRGRRTVWFDEQAVAAWHNTEPAAGPGAPRVYADLAIDCALVFKSVYHLSLRAAQGFLSSVVELMKLTLPIPDYSTVSRRQRVLSVRLALTPRSDPRHVVIDATGLKVYGAGEWHVWKHRVSRRRTWRKLHLGIDEATKEIVAVELTGSRVHDSQPLPSLLEQIPDPIGQASGDGAYDTRACYEAVLQRGATPTFVPRCTAHPGNPKDPTGWRAVRNHVLQQIEAHGRSAWQVLSGYTRQSIAENTMFRFKMLFGGRLWARSLETQRAEAWVKCAVLNRMTQLGMPETVRVG
jgi:Transposase DDE domain